MKVALATTHPIQYQVPWYRAVARCPEIELEVGFAVVPDAATQGVGFGVPFQWDVPLLDGYRWVELERRRGRAELSRFGGLRLRRPGRWIASGFEVVLVTGWNSRALVQVALAARRRGVPVVVRGDSTAGRRPYTARLVHRLLLGLYAAFLVVGKSNRDFYRGNGIAASRLFDAPHFVDNAHFATAAERSRSRRAELRARFGLRESALGVLFAGKLAPVKNVGELIEALALAGREGAELQLLVAGDGRLRGELERLARERGVDATFAGFLNQCAMPDAYAAADLLVLPSLSESWGLVVNEAMASQRPAIVSDAVGCAPDLVVSGETGWIYPSGAPGALARLLAAAAQGPERLAAMGRAAQQLVRERYSVERAVEGTLAALATVSGAR